MIGTQLGHYRIERLLGSGGMGDVYLAHDSRLGRRVALKILSRELAGDPDRRERFFREARAAAALNHPNIVTIHSVEDVDHVPFLTLELIEGQTLADVIPAGGLALDRVLDLSIPLADAIGAAHHRGITHRDLKPVNVMIASDGRVKVLDFGLAKIKEDVRASEAAMPTGSLTGEGRIVGTVAYMSPEQAAGKPVDQRSDVFSLGVILYEMATGVRPFQGDTQMSTLSAIIKDPPRPLTEVRPGLPRDFSRIVDRCLAKDPEDRYQSAKDLRNDLRALKNDLASGAIQSASDSHASLEPMHGAAGRLYLVKVAAGVLALAAILYIAARWSSHSGVQSNAGGRPFESIKLTRLTNIGNAGISAMSHDGRYVAYVTFEEGKQALWLRQIATTSRVELAPRADVRYDGIAFAPDGNYVYYVSNSGTPLGTLYRIPVLGGGARRILDDVDTAVTFSPRADQLAFLRRDANDGSTGIILASVEGTNQRVLATRRRPQSYTLQGASWSPDGKSIAVIGGNDAELRPQLVMVDVASGRETLVPTPDWRNISRVAWLPDGSGLLANAQEAAGEASSQIFLLSYPAGTARRLTHDLSSYFGLSVAGDGKSFVAMRSERRASVWTMPLDAASKATAITIDASSDDGTQGLVWAPDGRLVYVSGASGNPDIWIMNADGSQRVQLTAHPGHDVWPRVTNDGRHIVFVSDRDGGLRAWRMGLDGSGATRVSEAVVRGRINVSGDGKWVYYTAAGDEQHRASLEGGQHESLFPPDALARMGEPLPQQFHEPMPSPDGLTIAGHYQAQRGERIVVIPAGGGTVKRFESVPPSGAWSPDGTAFFYVETRDGVGNLMRQPVNGGPPSAVTRFTSELIFSYAVSPDQKQLALVRGQVSSDVVLISEAR